MDFFASSVFLLFQVFPEIDVQWSHPMTMHVGAPTNVSRSIRVLISVGVGGDNDLDVAGIQKRVSSFLNEEAKGLLFLF